MKENNKKEIKTSTELLDKIRDDGYWWFDKGWDYEKINGRKIWYALENEDDSDHGT